MDSLRIAVVLPCYNEEAAIAETVAGFRSALPGATIYVYDNNSSDRTAELARAAGDLVEAEIQYRRSLEQARQLSMAPVCEACEAALAALAALQAGSSVERNVEV